MAKELPEELACARELIDKAKLDDALEIIKNFEKKSGLTNEEKLWTLLLKGWISVFQQVFRCDEISNRWNYDK